MIQNEKDSKMIRKIAEAMLYEKKLSDLAFPTRKFTLSPAAVSDIQTVIIKRIARILEQTAFRLFLEYLNEADVLDLFLENRDAEEIDPYRISFVRYLSKDHFAVLTGRVPSLSGMVSETADLAVSVIREMLARMEDAQEEISDVLLCGNVFHEVLHIEETGDIHNRGHAAALIVCDTGTIVYKPHDTRIDELAHQLISTFFSDVLYSPAVVQKEGYGFAEFIENQPCTEEEDAKVYFYHLGGLAAVVQMLGSSDLHHSNVLAKGVLPVIIDNELLITPGRLAKEPGLRRELLYSLLYSSLLPCRKGDTELSVLFANDAANRACPVIDGKRKNVRDYPDTFLAGFEAIYLRCMKCRQEIAQFLSHWTGTPLRHLYRGTRDYLELFEKTLEPGWMEDPSLREQLLKELSLAMKRSGSDQAEDIAHAEADALLRGDIPYVYTLMDSRDLFADGHVIYPDFFGGSPLECALSRLDYLSEADLSFEKTLLKKAMTRVITRRKPALEEEEEEPVRETRHLSREELLEEAERLFIQIRDDAVYTPAGEIIWFGPDYFTETGMAVLGSGFIDGIMGLAVFFAAFAKKTGRDSLQKDAEQMLDQITVRLEKTLRYLEGFDILYPNMEDLSLTIGLSGKLFAFHLIEKYTGEKRYRMLSQRILNIAKKEMLQYEKSDVMTGLSGMLKLLCRYDDLYALDGAPEFAEVLALRIMGKAGIPYRGKRLWKTLSPGWAISGSGHGQSGIASSLHLAGKRMHRADFIEAAKAGFEFEADIYSQTLCAWPDRRRSEHTEDHMSGWCSGAAGIGLDALRIPYEGHELILERAIDSVLKEPLKYKDFLCCGNCAMIDFMIEAGRLHDSSLLDHANNRLAMMKERAEKTGHYNYVSVRTDPLFSSSLFYGASGIGYEMLRMAFMDEIESALL